MFQAYLERAIVAIKAMKDRTGSSICAITKYIATNNKGLDFKKNLLCAALKSGVKSGLLVMAKACNKPEKRLGPRKQRSEVPKLMAGPMKRRKKTKYDSPINAATFNFGQGRAAAKKAGPKKKTALKMKKATSNTQAAPKKKAAPNKQAAVDAAI